MSLIFHLVNRIAIFTCMKNGDKSMLLCYYMEKIDKVKVCA